MTEPIGQTLRKPESDEFRTATPGTATPGTAAPGTFTSGAAADSTTLEPARSGVGEPPATRGRTTIAGGVVEKIAALAAREVPGVNALGGGLARTLGAMRPGRASVTRGVKVEVGERQTAIDLEIVVEYGVSITEVAAEIRFNVIGAVERMTELEVVEVNIAVSDVHLPDESASEVPESRLQ
ncbi:Asp23/Gls24 family envelope stress response protein [Streptomyces xanthochromogenes]|uniref:Asp23/Gls24 family envelope stress response protein n=1 Tax=Streptomyces xanthochromogenes TaxID=67384 RepID=UPI00342D11CE